MKYTYHKQKQYKTCTQTIWLSQSNVYIFSLLPLQVKNSIISTICLTYSTIVHNMKLELDQITTYREMQLSGSVIRPQRDLETRSKSWKVVRTGRTEVQPPRSVQKLLDLRWQRHSQCWGLYHIYSIQIDNKK